MKTTVEKIRAARDTLAKFDAQRLAALEAERRHLQDRLRTVEHEIRAIKEKERVLKSWSCAKGHVTAEWQYGT